MIAPPPSACETCGTPLPGDGLEAGICPACLWGSALGAPVAVALPEIPGLEVLEEIAHGGMGVVYRTRQLEPERDVALKMLLQQAAGSEVMRERFRQEAAVLAGLDHAGILPVYQAGETAGQPWFTMKLATGGTLAARLKREGPMPPRVAAALCMQIAEAAACAHDHGVLHRDIKPGNVLFGDRCEPYLADFGIARLRENAASLTVSAGVLGTPCYMAPEVAARGAREATLSSDIYGLGAVLYEMLAGRPPFIVEGLGAMLRKIAEDEPDHPSTIAAVPRDLEVICLTCLYKEPVRRYASAQALADDLRRWLDGLPILARPASVAQRLRSWVRRKPALAVTTGALAATLAAGGVWFVQSRATMRESAATASRAQATATGRADLYLDAADDFEAIGRLDVLEKLWARLDASFDPATATPEEKLSRARLDTQRARVASLTGEYTASLARAQSAMDTLTAQPLTALPGASAAASAAARAAADICKLRGDFEKGLAYCDAAVTHAQGSESPERALGEAELTRSHVLELAQRHADGAAAAATAAGHFRAWQRKNPADPLPLLRLVPALRQQAACITYDKKNPRPSEGLAIFQEAEAEARRLCALKSPPEPSWERELGESIGWKSVAWRRMGKEHAEQAMAASNENLAIASRLHALDPANIQWERDVASCHFGIAQTWQDAGNSAEEEKARVQQEQAFGALVTRAPLVREFRINHMNALHDLAILRLAKGTDVDLNAARELFDRMVETSWPAVKRRGASRQDQEGWHLGHVDKPAKLMAKAGRVDDAVAFLQQVVATISADIPADGAEIDDAVKWFRLTRSACWRDLADILATAGRMPEALDANRTALAERVRLYREGWDANQASLAQAVGSSFQHTVSTHVALGRKEDALANAEQCLALWKEHLPGKISRFVVAETIAAAAGASPGTGNSLAARAQQALYGTERPGTPRDKAADEKLAALASSQPPVAK